MKKILFATGDAPVKPATMDFACYLAKLVKSPLTGIFPAAAAQPETMMVSEEKQNVVAQPAGAKAPPIATLEHQAVRRFEESCLARNVLARVYTPLPATWAELITATRFADAVVIDADFSLGNDILEPSPSHWAKKLLHESGCPVIISPFRFDGVSEVILTYDGSRSSLMAIREFVHLFPELKETRTSILQIWLEEDATPQEQTRLQDWLRDYFDTVDSIIIEGSSYQTLHTFLLQHPDAFIVMGGFGRGRVSRMVQPSASGDIMKIVSSPVFVAHY